jgi:hypothetical protein
MAVYTHAFEILLPNRQAHLVLPTQWLLFTRLEWLWCHKTPKISTRTGNVPVPVLRGAVLAVVAGAVNVTLAGDIEVIVTAREGIETATAGETKAGIMTENGGIAAGSEMMTMVPADEALCMQITKKHHLHLLAKTLRHRRHGDNRIICMQAVGTMTDRMAVVEALILWRSKYSLLSHVRTVIDAFNSRRKQRERVTVNVWPPSPKAPARELYVSTLDLTLPLLMFISV